jgi:hypothetical protein
MDVPLNTEHAGRKIWLVKVSGGAATKPREALPYFHDHADLNRPSLRRRCRILWLTSGRPSATSR